MSCVTSANCTAARAGTGSATNWNNDAWSMAYVNVDSDATTFNSSRATLDLPAGATVLFAGLYWGGDAPAAALRDQVKFDTPAPGPYQDLVATTFDTSTTTPTAYQGFRDVTGLVAAIGAGDYWVANVQGTAGATNKHAGWALVVAYRDAASPRQNLAVFDGFQDVKSGDSTSATLTGLTTPTSGTVDATVGVFAHEGDLGITGDVLALNATTLSNGLNPANNAFNSSITRRGVRLSAKNPDYVNQFSVEMDTFAADAIVAPGATSATVNMTSTQDRYYPGVITYAGEAETVPPQTTINSGPSGPTNDPTPTYAFSSNEAGSTFECRVDAGAWTSCSSPNTTASLADGAHTFEVRATDPAGNLDATPALRSFTVDTVAPQTTIDSGPSGFTNDATPTFVFSSSQAGSSFECRVDAGAWASCSSAHTTASLADGAHTFEVRATDPAGNVDPTPASRGFTVDTVAPNTTIDSGPSGPTNDATPTFAFSATQAGSTFECRVDGGAWGSCSTPETTASLTDGAHTFDVRATDPAGNVDPTPASRAFTVDTAAPQTTINSGPSGLTNDATPTFAFSSSQPGSSFECRVDAGAWTSCSSPSTTASLADGAHTFEVRAIDPAGNVDATPASRSFTVDTVAPQTTIDSGASGPTNDATPTFAFSADQAGSTFECRVDAGAWGSCSSAHTTASLADGAHTFEVRATDPAGNVDPTPASRAFTVDTAAPQTTIDSGPSGFTNDATPTFAFSSSQPGSSFECRVDAGAWGSCSTPETTASLVDGAHTFEVRATDPAGNVDATPASRSFTVDTIAPQTTIDSGPPALTNDPTPTITFSASQVGSTFECRVDAGAWASCSSAHTTASLADGAHTFEVRATDPAGNVDPTPASLSFTVDTAAPQTSIDSGPSGLTNDETPTFAFSSNQAGSTFECRIDGGAWGSCSTPKTTASLADGAHSFEVRATDPAGNVDTTPALRSFTVDTSAAQTSIDSGPSDPTNDATPTFAFSADQPGSTFECRVDGGAWASCGSPHTTSSLADGPHTFEVRATDPIGNLDASPASQTFTVDTVAPQTTIDSGPSGLTGDATPTFAFSSSQAGSTFECRVDAGAWGLCSTPKTTALLTDGAHSFEVRATDPAGNVDATPASRSLTVDTAAPQTTINSGPSGFTNDPTPTYAFSADEAGSSFECRVDGGAWGLCSTPVTTASLADGPHTFEVRATDPVGNVDPTPASRIFTVDTAAPQTTIDGGPSGLTNDATPTFAFSSSQAGSSFECRVDAGAWASCSSAHTTASLADGAHSFEVRATDPAGNVDPTPASRGFTVDTAAPQTTIDSGPSGPTNDATPTFTFSASQLGSTFECRVDAGAWASCSSAHTTASLADGAHSIEVRATDPAGNLDATPALRSFTVDTAAPQTTIDSGPSGLTSDATPTFAFSADQGGSSFECRVDAGAWASCISAHTTASLGDGPHTFEVRATDQAGNVDATPASRAFTVDTAAPNTTIDSGPSGLTNDATPTFTFSASQASSTFECRVDAGAWVSCSSAHTTASLADGAHTFEARATDPAGNVDATPASRGFTVDTAAPNTTIDSGPSGATNDPTPTFAFSATQGGSTFECRVDGGAWGSCSTPETTASLADGAHTFEVRATDPAGNVDATPASRSFTVDSAAPDTTIDSGPSGTTSDPTPTFTFSSDEPGSTFECRVDVGAWASCTSAHTTASLGDGTHSFQVRAIDPTGNTDASPAQRIFAVESSPPDTTIDSGPAGATNDPTPTFGFSSNELGTTFECRVDGGPWGGCSAPETTAAFADGLHSFEVRATDFAGNVDPTPASRAFTVDTAAPDTTIDSGPSGLTNDATPTFAFSADQAASSFECRLDGGAWGSCSTPETTASLTDGAHTLEVRATDPAGNVDPTPASRSFTVDALAPNTTIDSGLSGFTTDPTPTYAFSSNEAGSTFECRVDVGAWASCSSAHTTASLADGAHTFEVRATDPAGNVDATPATRSFTVDTIAPQTTIDSGPSGFTNDATPTFAFSSSQAGSTLECRVDGGAWGSCSTSETTASLTDGAHTFDVRATDPAGNVDPTPASRSFTVDTAAPDTTIDSGPSGPTSDATPTFAFSSSQPGSTFECRVDGGAWGSCSSGHTTAALGDGPHTFEVRATDQAGNVDATPASLSFTVATAVSNPDPPAEAPSDPPQDITPSESQPPPDLGTLAGSLVAERSCQRLGAGLRTKRVKVRGIGSVTVRIQASAIVMADDPLTVSVNGPRAGKGRLRSVGYALDGRAMRGSRRQPFALSISPAALARVGRHALALKLKPNRGRPGTVKLGMRTFPCTTVFRAYQKRTRAGSELKLRIDARDAITGTTFNVPSKLLPTAKAGLKVGTLRVVSAGSGSRSWSLAFGATSASPMLVGGVGAPAVTVRSSQVTVGGLPAGSGIVEVFLKTKRSALVRPRRSVGLHATVAGASAQRLSYKLRGRG
jgi:hypothetical protein